MLGVQCLTCRRRRVKCDAKQPSCARCYKDRRTCQGYDSHKWIAVEPANRGGRRHRSRPARPNKIETQADESILPGDAPDLLFSPPFAPSRQDSERRYWHIIESVDYCNSIVVPDLVPYPYARTYTMKHDIWRSAPPILHNIVLVITYNHRIVRCVSDDSTKSDLYKYRGETLRQLANDISSVQQTPPLLALVGVLMVIQAEIQLSAASSWDVHLRAARTLIQRFGGIAKCWQDLPHTRILLSFHFLIEIMSPVTTPTTLLSLQELNETADNLVRLAGIEHNLLASCCPLPLPLLSAITQINRLRGEMQLEEDDADGARKSPRLAEKRTSILTQLEKFDPEAWAARIISEFPDEGIFSERAIPRFKLMEKSEWIHIAQCYHSAVIIYALRSTISLMCCSSSMTAVDISKTEKRLQAETYTLGTTLDKLFLYFGDLRSTSLRPGLWRFTMFPSFIHALEMLVMRDSITSHQVERYYLDRMLSLGQMLGCRTMVSAVEVIERALQLKKRRGCAPGWHECFTSRSVFVI